TSFARRRFRGESSAVRERLEEVGRCFVRGYHAALEEDRPLPLAARLEAELELELQLGFEASGQGQRPVLLEGGVIAADEAASHLLQPLPHRRGFTAKAAPGEGGLFRRNAEEPAPNGDSRRPQSRSGLWQGEGGGAFFPRKAHERLLLS